MFQGPHEILGILRSFNDFKDGSEGQMCKRVQGDSRGVPGGIREFQGRAVVL